MSAPAGGPASAEEDILASTEAGGAAIRGGMVRVAGYGVGIVVSVVSAALLFRHLGVERGGQYVTVLSLATLAAGVTDAGLSAIGVREFSTQQGDARRQMLRSLLGIRLLLSGAGLLGAVAFAALAGYSGTQIAGTALAGAGLVLATFQGTLTIGLLARLELVWVSILELARQVLTAVVIVVLVLAGAGVIAFWAAAIPIGVLIAGLTLVRVRGTMPLVPAFDRAEWKRLLKDVVPFAVATAVTAVYFRLAIIVVSLVTDERQTGYFATSFRVIEVLIVVPSLVIGSAFPIFSHAAANDSDRLGYALGRSFDAALIVGAGIALGFWTGAPFVIDVIAGPGFGPSADVLRVQGIALALAFMGSVFGYGLLSLRRNRSILLVSLSGLAANAVVTTVLASADGARGAAIGTVVAEAVLTLTCGAALAAARVRLQITWTAIPRVAVAVALGLLVLATGLPSVVQAVIALAVYVLALVLLRAIPAELTDELLRRVRRNRAESV